MAIRDVKDETFMEETEGDFVIAYLGAEWSDNCQMIEPILEEIDYKHMDHMKIIKLNVDDNKETIKKYGIKKVPTLLYFHEGELVEQTTGYKSEYDIMSIREKYA